MPELLLSDLSLQTQRQFKARYSAAQRQAVEGSMLSKQLTLIVFEGGALCKQLTLIVTAMVLIVARGSYGAEVQKPMITPDAALRIAEAEALKLRIPLSHKRVTVDAAPLQYEAFIKNSPDVFKSKRLRRILYRKQFWLTRITPLPSKDPIGGGQAWILIDAHDGSVLFTQRWK